jgi:hypothetical protein
MGKDGDTLLLIFAYPGMGVSAKPPFGPGSREPSGKCEAASGGI